MKQDYDNNYEVTLNGHPCNDRMIHSGDYFVFKNNDNNKVIKTLFIATSDIQVGYKKYKLSKDTNIFIGRTPLNDISYDLVILFQEKTRSNMYRQQRERIY